MSAERMQELSRITGWLIPEFTEELPNGKMLNGITKVGYEMIMEGYACGQCLAMFDRFTLICPACFTPREIGARPEPTPQMWQDHVNERNAPVPYDKPPVENPFLSKDTSLIERMRNNPDVEQINLAEQTKKKKGVRKG